MVWLFCCLVDCLFAWFIVWQLDCWVVWLLSLRSLPVVAGLCSFVFLFGLWALPFRRRPFDVWLFACLVVWLFGCLVDQVNRLTVTHMKEGIRSNFWAKFLSTGLWTLPPLLCFQTPYVRNAFRSRQEVFPSKRRWVYYPSRWQRRRLRSPQDCSRTMKRVLSRATRSSTKRCGMARRANGAACRA